MISAEQWKEDMFDGTTAAHLSRKITVLEGGRLRVSIKTPVDQERMKDDTMHRTNGACGWNTPGGVIGLGRVFNKLNRVWSGGRK